LKIAYISLTVTKEGKPLDIKLEHSSGNQCIDQQAIQLAAGYTFRPARKFGGPVASHIVLQMKFEHR
jgi:TonB family protein